MAVTEQILWERILWERLQLRASVVAAGGGGGKDLRYWRLADGQETSLRGEKLAADADPTGGRWE